MYGVYVNVIPAGVTHLTFGSDFNKALIPGVIPSSVKKLTFGVNFKQPLIAGVIQENCIVTYN